MMEGASGRVGAGRLAGCIFLSGNVRKKKMMIVRRRMKRALWRCGEKSGGIAIVGLLLSLLRGEGASSELD
jgi:hypothetical protein